MIFNNYVTCGGGGGVTLFDGLGPLFEYGMGPCLNHIQSLQATLV